MIRITASAFRSQRTGCPCLIFRKELRDGLTSTFMVWLVNREDWKMQEIPLEVQMNAERLWDEGGYESGPTIIAKAIMAERERCAEIAEIYDQFGSIANEIRRRS